MNKNLIDKVREFIEQDPVRFHVPSHKGRGEFEYINLAHDITELSFSDNLLCPENVILNAQEEATEIFNSKKTFFTTNGATACVMTSICASVKKGEEIILFSDSHISAYYGAIHADVIINRALVCDHVAGVSLEDVKMALANYPNSAAIFMTYPTYYGCCTDLKSICEFLKQKNITIIVDESHGTHLVFSSEYPLSALECGADIVVHSGHKTINGLTQAGMLHIASDRVNSHRLEFYLHSFQSTSPSYLILMSLVSATKELKSADIILKQAKLWYNDMISSISDRSFMLLNHEYLMNGYCEGIDYLKMPLLNSLGLSGFELGRELENKYKIYSELMNDEIVLCFAGLGSNEKDYSRLIDALSQIKCNHTYSPIDIKKSNIYIPTSLEKRMSIKEAMQIDNEWCELKDCVGRVCADFVYVYPPGAPILVGGEVISSEAYEYMLMNINNIKGLNGTTIRVVK